MKYFSNSCIFLMCLNALQIADAAAVSKDMFYTRPLPEYQASLSAKYNPLDVQADVNRDGWVNYLDDETAESISPGVIVLPNLDDDSQRCEAFKEFKEFEGEQVLVETDKFINCNDATDDVSNGAEDIQDLSIVKINVSGQKVSNVNIRLVREDGTEDASGLFRVMVKRGDSFVALGKDPLTSADFSSKKKKVTLGLEATDVIRDEEQSAKIKLVVALDIDGKKFQDEIPLAVAPIITQHDLGRVSTLFMSPPKLPEDGESKMEGFKQTPPTLESMDFAYVGQRFVDDMRAASEDIIDEVSLLTDAVGDIWTQDYFEPGFVSRQNRYGIQTIKILLRSANLTRRAPDFTILPQFQGKSREEIIQYLSQLSEEEYFKIFDRAAELAGGPSFREAGAALYSQVRGPDAGVVQLFKNQLVTEANDSFNSTGNFTTIPPSPYLEENNLLGRMVYGSTPNPSFIKLLKSQKVQEPIRVDTTWLLVGHVDEFLTFLPSIKNPRGWVIGVADPEAAYTTLQIALAQNPAATILTGAYAPTSDLVAHQERKVSDVLADNAIKKANDFASEKINEALVILREELQLTEEDIVRIPVLYRKPIEEIEALGALLPNAVNGLHLGYSAFVSPKQFGPVVNGTDLLQQTIEDALSPHGVEVRWVDDFNYAHLGEGEIHCVTNTARDLDDVSVWW